MLGRLTLVSIRPAQVTARRCYRIKPGISLTAKERDLRTLKYLEEQLARVQKSIKQEEEDDERMFRTKTKSKGEDMFENHLIYLWERIIKPSEKKKLASYGIRSIEQLYDVYEEAQQAISTPGHPGIESLDERLQYAYHMYDTLPQQAQTLGREGQMTKAPTAFLNSRYALHL